MTASIVFGVVLITAGMGALYWIALGLKVTIHTNPGRAKILIDGGEVGRTNSYGSLTTPRIRAGDHSLAVLRHGYYEWKQSFNIAFTDLSKSLNVRLKRTRTICFINGSGEHQIDDSDRNGYSRFKKLLGKDEYDVKSINLLQKAEIPSECAVIVVGGPTSDYQQPEVDEIKNNVEDGGHALFMLDAPLKMGQSEIADNNALTKQLQNWGVTLNKDLILDLNPIGQLAGVGPQVVLVTSTTATRSSMR